MTCNNDKSTASLMRSVVGLSALAVGSAVRIATNVAPTTLMAASALNQTYSSGSCGLGGACLADPAASVIDVKAARAMAAAEVDTDGEVFMNYKGKIASAKTTTAKASTITIMNNAARTPYEQAMALIQQRGNVYSVIDEDGVDVSPQAKAQAWLSQNFDMQHVQHKSMSHAAAIAERYALAVFFYSLNGNEWETPLDFMSDNDVCGWNGLVSTGYYQDADSIINFADDDEDYDEEDVDENMDDDEHVATFTEDDEDERFVEAGVFCDDSGSVVSLKIPNYIGMEGSLPTELDLLSNLRILDLQQQPIEGPIPTEISNLHKLRRLSIQDTAVSGTIPTELALLTNLQELELFEDQLWGPIPDELGNKLVKVTTLQLSGNMFTGSIPESLGLMAELETFDISNNQMSGSIPPSLFNFLTKVRTLDFSNNEFVGDIPAEIRHISNRDITNLVIDLSHNRFTGSIPKELGEMSPSLEQIFLNDNHLSGKIPVEITWLRDSLMTFHVQNNELSGVMPLEFADMPWLFYINVSGNNLVGSLDDMLCNNRDEGELITSLYKFTADCGEGVDKPAEIICSCCTLCCVDGTACEEEE